MTTEGPAARTRAARRRLVARLTGLRYTLEEIAKVATEAGYTNCSVPTINRDQHYNLNAWQESIGDLVGIHSEHSLTLDADLGHMRRQWMAMPAATVPDQVAAAEFYIKTILPLMKERAKLLGLYREITVDIEGHLREWAREQGMDPQSVLDMAAEVLEDQGF